MIAVVVCGLLLIPVAVILYAVIKGVELLRGGSGVVEWLLALNVLEAGITPLYIGGLIGLQQFFEFHWFELSALGGAAFSAHLQTMLTMYLTMIGLLLVVPATRVAAHDPWQRFAARRALQSGAPRLAVFVAIFEIGGLEGAPFDGNLVVITAPVLIPIWIWLLFRSVVKICSTYDAMILAQTLGLTTPYAARFQSLGMGQEGLAVGSSQDSGARPLL